MLGYFAIIRNNVGPYTGCSINMLQSMYTMFYTATVYGSCQDISAATISSVPCTAAVAYKLLRLHTHRVYMPLTFFALASTLLQLLCQIC
jgi:hypothetical protein